MFEKPDGLNIRKTDIILTEKLHVPVRERKQVNNKLYIFGKDGRLVKKKGLYKHGKTKVYINKDGSSGNRPDKNKRQMVLVRR